MTSAATKTPIEGIEVCAFNEGGRSEAPIPCAHTAANGSYTLPELSPGEYVVEFMEPKESDLNFVGQSYKEYERLTVAAGVTLSHIDAALRTGGQITGTVIGASTRAPLEHALVCGREWYFEFAERCARTDHTGRYALSGLPAGEEYEVEFAPEEGGGAYLTQYFNDTTLRAGAAFVLVREGQATPHIDAALREGAQITGRVVAAATNAALAGIEVCAIARTPSRCTETEANGEYALQGLGTGSYKVDFSGLNYAPQYYDAQSAEYTADPVAATAGQTTNNIDAAMHAGGEITGTVISATTHASLGAVQVCASRVDRGSFGGCASTDAGGRYTVGGLARGEYYVWFSPPGALSSEYRSQYYSWNSPQSEPRPVQVTEGAPTEGIDASLQPVERATGVITGHVTSAATHGAIEGLTVCADGPYYVYQCSKTAADGGYTLVVPASLYTSYTIAFLGGAVGGVNYETQYYNNEPSSVHAAFLPVTPGETIPGIDAQMHSSGTIKGTVTDATTTGPVEGVTVCAGSPSPYANGYFGAAACSLTAADGTYTIGGLPSGAYQVEFSPAYTTTNYLPEFYDQKPSYTNANYVYVTADQATEHVDAALQRGGTVAGTVTSAETHQPLEKVRVCALRQQQQTACAETAADGTYTVTGLAPGAYTIAFYPRSPFVGQYYNTQPNLSLATQLEVASGGVQTGVDAVLQVGGTISGTVVSSASHEPLEGIQVCAQGTHARQCEATGSQGTYALRGLPTDSYHVTFYGRRVNGVSYLTQYYNDRASFATAQGVSVVAGSPSDGVDAAMHTGGEITGRVTSASGGAPLDGISVCAGPIQGYSKACSSTNSQGDYAITSLAPGEYTVTFARGASEAEYLTQYYDEKAQPGEATRVAVSQEAAASGINAAMHTAGVLSGKVTSAATGMPLAGVAVCAYETAAYAVGCEYTDLDGEYSFDWLTSGSYRVRFSTEFGAHFMSQFYAGQSSYFEADSVEVHPEATTPHIDAAMRTGGQITGTVTSAATTAPIEGISVCAERIGGGSRGCTSTNAGGQYEFSDLESGSYAVSFGTGTAAARYVPQYYNNRPTQSEAEPVPVTAEVATPHIDATMQLQELGEITGTVTGNASKEAIAGISVCASSVHGSGGGCTNTASNGTYSLGGLAPGEYDVAFTRGATTAGYLTQYYNDKNASSEATPVSVTAGHASAEINASLETLGRITGSVTSAATGTRLAGIEVCASGVSFVCTNTSPGGEYELRGLESGFYTVSFSTTARHLYLTQYYEGKESAAEAKQILVAAEATVSGVNASMRSGGAISGTVTDAATTRAIAGAKVCAGGPAVLECSFTGLDGRYTISELPPGEYAVAFATGTSGGAYKTQFYPNKPSSAEATRLLVGAETASPGIDAALEPGLPVDRTPPTIAGQAVEGASLTEEHGTWANSPTGYSYQWLRCDAFAEACFPISGATGQAYRPGLEDVGSTLRVEETAANVFGAGEPASSTVTAVVAAAAPINAIPPGIEGRPEQGQQLVALDGAWTNLPTEFAYQWLRCDNTGAHCSPLGATRATYTPVAEDVGSTIEVQEIASNAGGASAPATSPPTGVVSGPLPIGTELPVITGEPHQNATLTANPGTWTNSPSGFAYQWRRCLGGGAGCVAIAGAAGQTYRVVDADVHHTVKVEIVATNAAGSSEPALSHATPEVSGELPQNVTPPTVAGVAAEGESLVDSGSAWTNEPGHFAYQWLRCEKSGENCKAIAGAVNQTYRASEADAGSTLIVEEAATNSTGRNAAVRSQPSGTIATARLRPVAGDDLTTTINTPVTLDGSGSTPAREITGYRWEFGDGTTSNGASIVSHSYSQAGKYTATLTIESKTETATASVTVTVDPPPAQQVAITVQAPDHSPITEAEVVYIAADGSRTQGTTDSQGVATLAAMPDGTETIYAYKAGYKPETGQVTVERGAGHATVILNPGAVATAKLTSRELTLREVEEAGIDPSDPANQRVIGFEAQFAFGGGSPPVELSCYVNVASQFVGACGGGGGGGGGWDCSPNACQGGGFVAVPATVDNQPVIEWLTLPGSVTALKQFFSVSMIVQNLSSEGFSLTGGHAVLNLASGVSLAPTATAQSESQALPDIPGGGSATATWIVRGDEPGKYYLSADYNGTLSKVEAPVTLHATLAEPLRVYGAEALSLTVKADEGAPQGGVPYHVVVGLTNHAPVPLYNVSLNLAAKAPEHFIFQPGQAFGDTFSEVPAGHTVYSHTYIYVPSSSLPAFNPSLSSVGFAGQAISPGSAIEAVVPPPLYSLTAPTDTPNEVHLHWQPVSGATGYEIFTIPNLETPFGEEPTEAVPAGGAEAESKLPASTTDAYIPESAGSPAEYFAVSAIVGGHLTLGSPVISAVPGLERPPVGGGGGGGGGGAGGGGPSCGPGQVDKVEGRILQALGCFTKTKNGTFTSAGRALVNGIGFAPKAGTLTIDPQGSVIRGAGSGAIELDGHQVWAWAGSLDIIVPLSQKFILIPDKTPAKVLGFPIKGSLEAEFTNDIHGGKASLTGEVALNVLGEDIEATLEVATDNKTKGGLASAEIEVEAAEAARGHHAFEFCKLGSPAPTGWHCENVTAPNGREYPRLLANNPGVVRIGGVLPVEDVALSYEADHRVWGAKAALAVGDLLPGPDIVKKRVPTLELGGKIGTEPTLQLYAFNAGVKNLDLPIGPALLKELGFELELHPEFGLGGDLELETLAHTMEIGAGFEYKRGSKSGFDLVLHGHFSLESQLTVDGRVEYDGRNGGSTLVASGTFTKSLGPVWASVTIGGGFEPHHFELTGDGSIGAFGANVQGHGIVSDAGLGACGEVHVLIFNGEVGFKHFWSGETDFEGCDFSGLYTVKGASAAAVATGHAFRLPPHRSKEEFAVVGASAPPSVTLIGPRGQTLQTPAALDQLTFSKQGAMVGVSSSRTTYFIVSHPGGGIWRIVPTPGAPPPIRYEQADPLLPLDLSGHVSGRGRVRTFSWRMTPQNGESVRFIQTDGGGKPLASTRAGRGRVRFPVALGPRGRRTIVALVSFDGFPRRQVTVASFSAPALAHPEVSHAVYRVSHGRVSIGWGRVAGASYYEVQIQTSVGLAAYRFAPSTTRLTLPLAAGTRVKRITIATSVAGTVSTPVSLRRLR